MMRALELSTSLGTLVSILVLVYSGGGEAQTLATGAQLRWVAPSAHEVCGYVILGKGTPGFIGEPGTFAQTVSAGVTTATVPRDSAAVTTVYTVVAVGPAEGRTCATTETSHRRFSGFSNQVFVNDDWLYYRRLSDDADRDGIPDVMELELTGTDPANRDSDGDGIGDGFEYALWEQWLEGGWRYDFNANGTNGLNDANADDGPGHSCAYTTDQETNWPDRVEMNPFYGRLPFIACQ